MCTRPTMQDILEDVCQAYNQDAEYVRTTDSKAGDIIKCRRIFCYIAYLMLGYQQNKIREFMRYRAHGSVSHHSQQVRDWLRIRYATFMNDWHDYESASKLWPIIQEYRAAA